MKVLEVAQTRQEYLRTQIARSDSKFALCKVSMRDALRYQALLAEERVQRAAAEPPGPVLCLGTRNGREVDLFRIAWSGPRWQAAGVRWLERPRPVFSSWWPAMERWGRPPHDVTTAPSPADVVGVEINPRAARPDVWIGSFDAMPTAWAGRFGVLFSNSFDQSEDPRRTAAEWRRVARPGAYLILCFSPEMAPTATDRVGGLTPEDVRQLFGGALVACRPRGSTVGYTEMVLRW